MRKRILSPGFFDNYTLGGLPPLARLLFQGLWCYADREGRFKWEPDRIKVKILPYDTSCDIHSLLESLRECRLIRHYSVNGKQYGDVRKFHQHQRPHRRESPSKLPSCEEGSVKDSPGTVQGQEKDSPRLPVSVSVSVKTYTPIFEKIWSHYPRKIDKRKAFKKFQSTLKKGAREKDVSIAVKHYEKAMAGKEKEHIKHGATFFGPDEPWKEWVDGPPDGFSGVHTGPAAEDPHKNVRCVKCLSWWTTIERDERGICQHCRRDETLPPN